MPGTVPTLRYKNSFCTIYISVSDMADLTFDILNLPRAEAEQTLNEMDLSDQLSLVLMMPWERRQELILLSEKATHLVQSMPSEELFWTIKAIGPQDALQILSLSTPEQLQLMLDLDWWHKDRLRPEKIITWLLLMFEASEDLVAAWVKWISQKDEWLVPAILQMFTRTYKRPDDMDTQEARDTLPAFTLDDIYYVAFKKEKTTPLFAKFLMKLLETGPGVYRDAMEIILNKTGSEILENTYRLRKSRLGDQGLLDYYDSLDIYAPLPGNRVRRLETDESVWSAQALAMPFVPTLYMGDYPTLLAAINALTGTASLARVLQEWIGAANKVLMADSTDLDDPDALKQALLKVAALLNLGLELEKQRTGDKPRDILGISVIEDLIRLSNRAIRNLSVRARTLFDRHLVPEDLACLPESWSETIKALVAERPGIWVENQAEIRWISTTGELSSTSLLLDRIERWASIMNGLKPHWSQWEKTFPWDKTNFASHLDLTWPIALLTALARRSLEGEFAVWPVSQKDLPSLRQAWFNRNGVPMSMEELSQLLQEELDLPKDLSQFIRVEIGSILRDFGEEIQNIPWDQDIDGRFLTSIFVLLAPEVN